MYVIRSGSSCLSREAGRRLLWASVGIAAAVILQALMQKAGFGSFSGVLVLGAAGLLGGSLLNAHARVHGLPSTVAGIMAVGLYLVALLDPFALPQSGGAMFVAILLSTTARTWRVGLTATLILIGGLILAALT